MARIVLAEDDTALRHYLKTALERGGHEVHAVDNGEKALAAIGTKTYDLLISDVVMPVMDGIELAKHTAAEAPDTRIMFITGFAGVAMQTMPKFNREAPVCAKPFHLKDMVKQVDEFLLRTSAA
jgi:two-component system cell cycle response regulator CpdR